MVEVKYHEILIISPTLRLIFEGLYCAQPEGLGGGGVKIYVAISDSPWLGLADYQMIL